MNLLKTIAIISLITGGISSLIIGVDLLNGHSQRMWIINIVWPVTGLYAGLLALIAYYNIVRKSMKKNNDAKRHNANGETKKNFSGKAWLWERCIAAAAAH